MPDTKPDLIDCRACGHQISVKAKSCPNCGDRITLKEKVLKPYQNTKNFLTRWYHYYQIEKEKKKWEKKPILMWVLLLYWTLVIVFIIFPLILFISK